MKLRTSFALSSSLASLLAIGIVACSQGADSPDASVAASPLVQAAGVQRIKFVTVGDVTHVDLLDEAGQEIGTLALETTGDYQVHARQTLQGQTLDATWDAQELSFTRNNGEPVSVRAGEKLSDALEDTLESASDALTVATFVAAQVGVYSPVDTEGVLSQPLYWGWGTGCSGHWNYSGSASTWSSSSSSALACQQASAQAAYSTCVQINGSQCNTSSTTTSTTTVTPGYYTGYTCTTTISVGYNCN